MMDSKINYIAIIIINPEEIVIGSSIEAQGYMRLEASWKKEQGSDAHINQKS